MISSKVAKSIKITVNLRHFCLTEILLTVYNPRILPCLPLMPTVLVNDVGLYLLCSHTTTSTPPEKAVQIIIKFPPCAHSYPLFKTLHILSTFKMYKHQVSCFVFLHATKPQPITLSFLFHLYL